MCANLRALSCCPALKRFFGYAEALHRFISIGYLGHGLRDGCPSSSYRVPASKSEALGVPTLGTSFVFAWPGQSSHARITRACVGLRAAHSVKPPSQRSSPAALLCTAAHPLCSTRGGARSTWACVSKTCVKAWLKPARACLEACSSGSSLKSTRQHIHLHAAQSCPAGQGSTALIRSTAQPPTPLFFRSGHNVITNKFAYLQLRVTVSLMRCPARLHSTSNPHTTSAASRGKGITQRAPPAAAAAATASAAQLPTACAAAAAAAGAAAAVCGTQRWLPPRCVRMAWVNGCHTQGGCQRDDHARTVYAHAHGYAHTQAAIAAAASDRVCVPVCVCACVWCQRKSC